MAVSKLVFDPARPSLRKAGLRRLWLLGLAALLALAPAACRRDESSGTRSDTTETRGAKVDRPQQAAPPPGADKAQPPQGNAAATNAIPPTEGTLEVRIEGNAPQKVDFAIKGEKVRLSLSSTPNNPKNGLDAIIDAKQQKATLLMNDQHTYSEIDLAQLAKQGGQALERTQGVRLTQTGKTDSVSGKTCEILRLEGPQSNVTACAIKGGPSIDLAALEKSANFTAPDWLEQLLREGYIPLRVTVTQKDGAPLGSVKVTDWSHGPVPENEFMVPKGYSRVVLPGLPASQKAQ